MNEFTKSNQRFVEADYPASFDIKNLMKADNSEELYSSANLEMIRRLENIATFGQAAIQGSNQIIRILHEIQELMKDLKLNPDKINLPDSVIQNFIDTRLNTIRSVISATKFKGKDVLSGDYSPKVIIEGKRIRFVKAMNHLKTKHMNRLPVQVYRAPTQSKLSGFCEFSDMMVQRESLITLIEGNRFLRYRLKDGETATSLLKNLQNAMEEHGFGVTVRINEANRLTFVHNQYGSNYTLSAMSETTNLVSDIPGDLKSCELGLDIQGSIGDETLIGNGKFLISGARSSNAAGLIIHFNGNLSFTGETVGYITVNPHSSGHLFDDGFVDYYCVPSLLPESLSLGVENKTNISSLAEIKGNSLQSVSDSLLLIQWAIEDIELFLNKIKSWENKVIEQTLTFMREHMISPKKEIDSLLLSKDKAEEMSLSLQKKLSIKKPLIAI